MRIYICPALMDWLVFLVHFAVLYAAGERRVSMGQCAWLGGVFQLAYMGTSLLIGALLTRRNARALLFGSTVFCTLTGIASLVLTHIGPLMTAMGLLGICLSVFFNSFQTFMRGESRPGNLARTAGFYTFAWSTGAAMGFLSSGVLYRDGRYALAGLTLLVGVVVLSVLLRHKPRPHDAPSSDEHVEGGSARARPVNPGYVWVGWLLACTAMFVQRPVQTFFPAICARTGIAPLLAGLPLFLHMLLQALAGFGMIRHRDLLYRRTPLLVAQGSAALVLLLVWQFPVVAVSMAGISLLGLYAGFAYFCAVYYASNSGRRSFNIGVNEFLVGFGSFAGLFISEWCVRRSGNENTLYLVVGTALLASALLQVIIGTIRKQTPEMPASGNPQNAAVSTIDS